MVTNFVVQDDVKLKIYGVDFSLDSTDIEMIKKLENFGSESQEFADTLKDRKDYSNAMTEVIQFTLDSIDKILGDGSSQEIFKGTKVSLNKAVGVIEHISEEIGKARKVSANKFSPNRAKRN